MPVRRQTLSGGPRVAFCRSPVPRASSSKASGNLWTKSGSAPEQWQPSVKGIMTSMTSQNYVVWKDAFSVGSEAIDSQHQGMFGLLNDLYNALEEGRSQTHLTARTLL